MSIREITLDELTDTLFSRPGLVIGNRATCLSGELREITKDVREVLQDETCGEDLNALFELVRSTHESEYETALSTVKQHFKEKVGPNTLNHLVKAGWSACISLTIDYRFENLLRSHFSSLPTERDATVVSKESLILPSSTLPIFKLMGDIHDIDQASEVALATSDLMKRRIRWANILKPCSDYLKGSPLIFLGTDTNLEDVQWLLSAISTMPHPVPNNLIFLKSDNTVNDKTVSSLLNAFDVKICDSTILEICETLAAIKPRQGTLNLTYSVTSSNWAGIDEGRYKQIVSIVPNSLPDDFDFASNQSAVVDSLFRPHHISWLPYLLDLAAKRSVTYDVIKHIEDTICNTSTQGVLDYVFLHGDASVGKTTVLKQIAVALAKKNYMVVWVRRRWSGTSGNLLKQLSYDINKHASKVSNKDMKLIVICDNPAALNIAPKEMLDHFSDVKCDTKFIFSERNSEYLILNDGDTSLSTSSENDFEVENTLDDSELKSLAEMLVGIKAEETVEAALNLVERLTTKHSMDVLCSLWYLVPETKAVISNSLEEEYLRLGQIRPAIERTASSLTSKSTAAKEAYEAVTVMSNMGEGLPLEVLVRYLKVDYDYLLDMYKTGTPIWGLIYDDVNEDANTVQFRTRNEVVTRVLLDLVNGGAVGHAGEAAVIRKLISACEGGSSLYRDFILTIIVKCKERFGKIFSYSEGLEIFDIAREAIDHKDRTLEHHKGLWMRQDSSQLGEAYKQLEYAESCEDFPGTTRKTPIAHIHTSKAATVLNMIQTGQQDKESGAEEIRRLLSLATNESFFDGHTVHIAANTYFKLSKTSEKSDTGKIEIESVSNALYIIENGLQKIGTLDSRRNKLKNTRSIELLSALRSDILSSTGDLVELKETAEHDYESSGSGSGFVLACRVELNKAIASDKGTLYNKAKEYLEYCLDKEISDAHKTQLLATRIDLIIRWRLQKNSGAIDWSEFRADLEHVMTSPEFKDDNIKMFYSAVAAYHLDQSTQASAYFSHLRRTNITGYDKSLVRCWYVGTEGTRKRLQCHIKKDGDRYYVEFPELRIDSPLKRLPPGIGIGSTTHAYLGFSFFGTVPIFDKSTFGAELLLA